MNKNRLHLNFKLETSEERRKFLDEYTQRAEFIQKPLTEEELEMCGNYLLWGKDSDGKNSVQKKIIEIKTRNGTWDKQEDESLDMLLETSGFNEAQISHLNTTSYRAPREVFSRKKALENAPAALVPIFIDLFNQIDKLDLMLNFYDLAHGKRKNSPREELINKFTQEEQEKLKEEASHLNQYKYLKMRHYLVELRRQQFTLKDSYSSVIQFHNTTNHNGLDYLSNKISFEEEIEVLPLGIKNNEMLSKLIFREEFIPEDYTEKELEYISKYYWNKKKYNGAQYIDFRNIEHVYNIFLLFFELEDETFKKEIESETDSLLVTLEYYIEKAKLSNLQKDILSLKKRKIRNQEIASIINKKYNKTYTTNYISTIFRQKIIKQINAAAMNHEKIVSNIFFPENFKKCSTCGKTLLKDSDNFVKKTKSKDGFSNRCKRCDKIERDKKKGVFQ